MLLLFFIGKGVFCEHTEKKYDCNFDGGRLSFFRDINGNKFKCNFSVNDERL